jgi:hypothetical protein
MESTGRVLGNTAAAARAGEREPTKAAGGARHVRSLPVARKSGLRTETVAQVPSARLADLDFFYMTPRKKQQSKTRDFRGFLLMMQPTTYFLAGARVRGPPSAQVGVKAREPRGRK